jgi:ribosomal protein S18 acetylase RimI-like enzyme
MKTTIRRATPKDASIIAQYNLSIAEETEGLVLDRKRLFKGIKALLSDKSKGFCIVAVIDGCVAGQLMITFEWSDWRCATIWWIQSVYVAPEFRRAGVFTKLFRRILREARKNPSVGGLRLYVEHGNRRAQQIYKHLGMNRANYEMYEVDFVIDRTTIIKS